MSRGDVIVSELDTVLTEEELRQIDSELRHIPFRSGAAIDALKIVQADRGWVSDECLVAIARYLKMSVDELEGVATFYNLVFRKPVGDKVILLCDSVSCWIRGCDGVKATISATLGIDFGETTADNRYTLLPITCLGACDRAPVMMVGEELETHLDDARIAAMFGQEKR